MEQYIKKSALVAEIARQKAQWRICKSSEAKYRREMLDDISSFIDTLEVKEVQEKPVSEDLEEAINAYIGYAPEVDECSSVYGKRLAFKAGAEWQKSQGVTKEAVIGITPKEYFISISQSTVDMLDLCAGDKVIVQLRKKEDKI